MKRRREGRTPDSLDSGRRRFLKSGVALAGAVTACGDRETLVEPAGSALGEAPGPYGDRSAFEKSVRLTTPSQTPETGGSRTPLQDSCGILTPSSLHFERHHAGVPRIDPARHRLLIHGMVDRPLVLSVEELRRLPSVSRIHFIECSGNSLSEWASPQPTPQRSHGMASCSEWTGVPLALLLEEAGVQAGADWIIGEGADACKMHRSIPMEKARADVLVAWGQNGEAIRPEQGYPLRLVLPGWEGNTHIKWLRRLKVVDQPYMGREETSKYTDLMPDGTARQFTFIMEAKSVVTFPAGGSRIVPGIPYEITGLAWSGKGAIESVEISTDRGRSWRPAHLQEPRLPMAWTRFRMPWTWDGEETTLQSRCTDETGFTQPSREALMAARGLNSHYHYNGITAWKIQADGSVRNAHA